MKFSTKKNKLQLSALLLALSSTFVLLGCGGGASDVGSDTDESVRAATASNSSDDACKSKSGHTEKSSKNRSSSEKEDDDDKNENENDDENEIEDENCTTSPAKPANGGTTGTTTTTAAPTATGTLGKTAWASNCASCHGMNTGKGSNASSIMQAIANNTGGMGILTGRVTAADANNIAEYVANPTLYP
ncbi:MAG: cytochrome c [Burkholderiaceae bacterium]